MAGTPLWPRGPRRTARTKGFWASALNVTTLVAIFGLVIFAIVTQLLAANGAISLSTTLQLTMWLVVLGFIVVLAIAYMFFRVFEPVAETAGPPGKPSPTWQPAPGSDANGQREQPSETEAHAEQKRSDAQEDVQPRQDGGSPKNPTDGPRQFMFGWSPDGSALKAEDAWVPPYEFRHLEGAEYSVSTEEVFPDGCYLDRDSIKPVSGKPTGQQVYECRVVDLNQTLKDGPHDTVVKILADQMPSLASMPRYGWVEFEHLTITPYVTDEDPMRIRYWLRATGLHPVAAPTRREQATWTVPPGAVPAQRPVPPEEDAAHVGTEDASSGAGGTS